MKTLKKKTISVNNRRSEVRLQDDGHFYFVIVDKDIYKMTPNELFAVQTFNAI